MICGSLQKFVEESMRQSNPNMQKKQCFANKLQVLKMRMLWSQAHSRKAITKWCSEALGGKSGEQEEEKGKRHFGSAKET